MIKRRPILFVCFAISIFFTNCYNTKPTFLKYKNPDNSKVFKSRSDFYRDYAFCQCIYYAYKKDSIKLNDASSGIYSEMDDLSIIEGYNSIDSAAKRMADSIPKMVNGDLAHLRPISINCIQFYKSKKLGLLIDSLLQRKK